MKKEIEIYLDKHFDVYGYVSVKEYIERRNEKAGMKLDHSFLDGYKTIVTLGLSHPSEEVKYKGKGYGILSRFSYGLDYHKVVGEKLKMLSNDLDLLGIKSYGSVDVSKLNEKDAAMYSNIGFQGKNQLLINKIYGSYMYLSTLLIDTLIDKNIVAVDDCGECTLCIDACPSGALDNGFKRELCISHISQEKIPFDISQISHFKKTIYGCDICQKVCPKNKGIDFHLHSNFEPDGNENINIKELLLMSNREFKAKYGNNTSSWVGPLVIKRNAICIVRNQGLKEYLPIIKELSEKHKDVLWYNKTANIIIDEFERE